MSWNIAVQGCSFRYRIGDLFSHVHCGEFMSPLVFPGLRLLGRILAGLDWQGRHTWHGKMFVIVDGVVELVAMEERDQGAVEATGVEAAQDGRGDEWAKEFAEWLLSHRTTVRSMNSFAPGGVHRRQRRQHSATGTEHVLKTSKGKQASKRHS
jgi:hypothetical protein